MNQEFNLKICSVCDRLVFECNTIFVDLTEKFINVCKERLKNNNEDLDDQLPQYYDISHLEAKLNNVFFLRGLNRKEIVKIQTKC